MTKYEIGKALENVGKGTFVTIKCKTLPPVSKAGKGMVIEKVTMATFRTKISYLNMKSTKAKIASGATVTGKLPWGSWDAEFPGLIINHKGNDYVRFYPAQNKITTKYYVNGVEIEKERLKDSGLIQNSYWNRPHSDTLDYKCENVVEIYSQNKKK